MADNNLETTWDSQYENDNETALKDKNLFSLEINAILDQLGSNIPDKNKIHILELGCGTGHLLSNVCQYLKDKRTSPFEMVGVDFSGNAIEKANGRKLENTSFECASFSDFLEQNSEKFDVVVTQRSIMAVMKEEEQEKLFLQIRDALNPGAVMILSECFSDGFEKFNSLRAGAGLSPIEKVWHSRHLDESMLEKIFNDVSYLDFCSTYMLVTRLVYPLFEEPKHNQFIHDFVARIPNSGNESYLKIAVIKMAD